MKIIGHIKSDFPEKFGIPRQSGLTELVSRIIFEPEYRVPEAFRGLEGYSHIWIIWQFSEAVRDNWQPTVRPPVLGGNTRMGVFATRSPYRPNPVGLSSVRLEKIDLNTPDGPVLYVRGADIMDGTPVYDIKPYLAYTDSHPDAADGFALNSREGSLKVTFDDDVISCISAELKEKLISVLSHDPRPRYQHSTDRVYTMSFSGYEVSFTVKGEVLTVISARDAMYSNEN